MVTRLMAEEDILRRDQMEMTSNLGDKVNTGHRTKSLNTPPRKLESKNFCALTSAIHQKKRIACRISVMCGIKSVPGAPEEIFHF